MSDTHPPKSSRVDFGGVQRLQKDVIVSYMIPWSFIVSVFMLPPR